MINKKIRLIELFGGVGCQTLALDGLARYNGLKTEDVFEHYRYIDNDKFAVKSYNAVHNTTFEPIDIRDVTGKDIGVFKNKDIYIYIYILTYSYPCTSISQAGRMEGMDKGSGTASSLLWEVERILKDCYDNYDLPDILIMENVPAVHGKKNLENFNEWIHFLESIGYHNSWKDLNAADYGMPQSRDRCFMVSSLDNINFEFPNPIELKKEAIDYLDYEVDEKYYVDNDKTKELIQEMLDDGRLQ